MDNKEKLVQYRDDFRTHYGKKLGFNTTEFHNLDFDVMVSSAIALEMLDEIKGLRADLAKVEAPKVEAKPVTTKK